MQDNFSYTRPTTPPLRIRSAPPLTQGRQALRGTKDGGLPLRSPVSRPKRRGFTGGTWFLSPAQTAPGAPFDQTASVAGKTGSLRHCAVLAARGRSRAARAGECRRPIFGNSFAGNLWNSRGPRKSAAFVGRGAAMAFPQKRPRSGGEARRRTKREDWLRLGMPYGGRPF